MKPVSWRYLLLTVLVLAAMRPASAQLAVSLGAVQGQGWRAESVELQLADAGESGYALSGDVARLVLPRGLGAWSAVRLRCANLQLVDGAYQCPALTLEADTPQGRQRLSGSLRFRDAAHWTLTLDGARIGGGRWSLNAVADGDWQAVLKGNATPAGLLALWPGEQLPDWGWSGRLAARLTLRGSDLEPQRAELALTLAKGAWSSADGLQAGQELRAQLQLSARRVAEGWRAELRADSDAGQVYADPVYLELNKHPLHLAARIDWPAAGANLSLSKLQLGLGRLLAVSGAAELPLADPAAVDGRVQLDLPDLAAAYPVLVQPFGYGGVLGGLDMGGTARLSMTLAGAAPRLAAVTLERVNVADRAGRFVVDGLDGKLHWQASGTPPVSRLRWQGGRLYQVAVGAGQASLLARGDSLTLTEALELPLLGGRLRIPQLAGTGLGGDTPRWQAALEAQGLSLPQLSQALGWPRLDGELSVEIPAVHYADHVLALDGTLQARAFDGTVRVSGLELRDPLSPAPMFRAEASLENLDLERLTRVFDFGRITGRLQGEVRDLELVGWEPVAFQAVLQNPPDDDRPHRISQRAVESLTALGNNGAVALSGTFLRFFESFSYDRLRLSVNLKGQRAQLDGIPHPGGGYYLVKGAGIPRIDVIGRNRDVAWVDLVKRLKDIQLKGAQVR